MNELPVLHDKCIELLDLLVILPRKTDLNVMQNLLNLKPLLICI